MIRGEIVNGDGMFGFEDPRLYPVPGTHYPLPSACIVHTLEYPTLRASVLTGIQTTGILLTFHAHGSRFRARPLLICHHTCETNTVAFTATNI